MPEPRTKKSTILEVQTKEFDLAKDWVVARRIGGQVSRQSLIAALAKSIRRETAHTSA